MEGQVEGETELIYVMLPVALGPIDRGELFEDPLDDELQAAQLGYVSGGGTSLGEQQPDGSRPIVYCGVDVEAHDLDRTLELLRDKLPELDCPAGTQLQYSRDDIELQDEFDGASWTVAQPRSETQPGFGA